MRSIRHWGALVAVVVSLCLLSRAEAAGGADGARFGLQAIGVSQGSPGVSSYFVYDSQPGAAIRGQVRVTNSGGERGTARLYAVDAATGRTSGTVFLSREDPLRAAGAWLALDSSELTLDPGESRVVGFSVAVPAGARPGQHVGGIVAEDVELKGADGGATAANVAGVQVRVQTRTAVAVQVNLPGARVERLEVADVTVGGEQGYQTLALTLRNSGTEMLKPSGRLRVSDAKGREVQSLPLTLDTLLPETEIAYPVLIEGEALGAGSYSVTVELSYGGNESLSETLPLTVTRQQAAQVFQARPPLTPPQPDAAPTPATVAAGRGPLLAGVLALLLVAALAALLVRTRRARSGG